MQTLLFFLLGQFVCLSIFLPIANAYECQFVVANCLDEPNGGSSRSVATGGTLVDGYHYPYINGTGSLSVPKGENYQKCTVSEAHAPVAGGGFGVNATSQLQRYASGFDLTTIGVKVLSTAHYAAPTSSQVNSAYPGGCPAPDPCEGLEGQPGAPVYTGLPYDAQTYEETGICDNGCAAKPAAGPILNSYAADGSGYIIGPWIYTGGPCEAGVTSELPPQPEPEDQCKEGESACQAHCQGKVFQFNCDTGQCECFGPGSYTPDPPLDPTTPTPDPGSPAVPGAQTPATDPGGDAQLGAQIENQGKQIGQGDAQLAQLGAINNKLGAVISNQGKQIGQGDTAIDYARRQLGALEDIRNELAEENNADVPGLPDQPELDGSIPDTKNWTEYDDAETIGQEQGQKQIDIIEGAQGDSPFTFGINTSGSDPCLSGPMFGTQIDICFNRPWMLTGYAIMNGITISIGYLQAFLMIQRVVTGA